MFPLAKNGKHVDLSLPTLELLTFYTAKALDYSCRRLIVKLWDDHQVPLSSTSSEPLALSYL